MRQFLSITREIILWLCIHISYHLSRYSKSFKVISHTKSRKFHCMSKKKEVQRHKSNWRKNFFCKNFEIYLNYFDETFIPFKYVQSFIRIIQVVYEINKKKTREIFLQLWQLVSLKLNRFGHMVMWSFRLDLMWRIIP